jgi:hypothetical protein
MREVRPPARPHVQTRVGRTQASYLTARSVLRAVSETRGSLRLATGHHPRAHVVCALPHKDKVAFYVPSLRCRQASQSNTAEQYIPRVRSTTSDPMSAIEERWEGVDQEGKRTERMCTGVRTAISKSLCLPVLGSTLSSPRVTCTVKRRAWVTWIVQSLLRLVG